MPKSWGNFASGGTPLNAAALIDLETRVTDYAADGSVPYIDAEARGARFTLSGDPTFDNLAILQACLNELNPANAGRGGTLVLPAGIGYISNQLIVPNACRILGQGKRSTEIRMFATGYGSPANFPSNTAAIRLGDDLGTLGPAVPVAFAQRLEHLAIDCGGITNSTAVYTRNSNEGSGCFHVAIGGCDKYGIFFDRNSIVGCREVEIICGGAANLPNLVTCIYMLDCAGYNFIDEVTALPDYTGANPIADAAIVCSGTQAAITNIHPSGATYGIRIAGGLGTIDNIQGNGTITNSVIKISASTSSWVVSNVYGQGSVPNLIVDDFNSKTVTGASDTAIRHYNQGYGYVNTLRLPGTEIGPGQGSALGGTWPIGNIFFNSTPTSGSPVGWIALTPSGTLRPFGLVYGEIATIAYSASMTPNALAGEFQKITVNNTSAMTINAPTNPTTGRALTIDIVNGIGGGSSVGAITWNAAFKLSGAFVNPADTKRRTITFYYDGTNWVEVARAAADI